MKAKALLLFNLHSTSLNMFLLFISITKQSSIPISITNREIQLISSWFPKANSISPSGTNIRSARSINGKNKFRHIKNLDLKFIFLDVTVFTFFNAYTIPLAHLFLCFPKLFSFSGTSVKAMAFFCK